LIAWRCCIESTPHRGLGGKSVSNAQVVDLQHTLVEGIPVVCRCIENVGEPCPVPLRRQLAASTKRWLALQFIRDIDADEARPCLTFASILPLREWSLSVASSVFPHTCNRHIRIGTARNPCAIQTLLSPTRRCRCRARGSFREQLAPAQVVHRPQCRRYKPPTRTGEPVSGRGEFDRP